MVYSLLLIARLMGIQRVLENQLLSFDVRLHLLPLCVCPHSGAYFSVALVHVILARVHYFCRYCVRSGRCSESILSASEKPIEVVRGDKLCRALALLGSSSRIGGRAHFS